MAMSVDGPDAAGQHAGAPVRPAADALLDRARLALADAARAHSPEDRFCLAHLGSLRAAAALVATYGRAARRRRLVSVWVLLDAVAPAFAEWSAYFADAARTRAAIEAGAHRAVTARAADDQVRAAAEFCGLVEVQLGRLPLARAS